MKDAGRQEVLDYIYNLAQQYAMSQDWEIGNELDEVAFDNGIEVFVTDEGVEVEGKVFNFGK